MGKSKELVPVMADQDLVPVMADNMAMKKVEDNDRLAISKGTVWIQVLSSCLCHSFSARLTTYCNLTSNS